MLSRFQPFRSFFDEAQSQQRRHIFSRATDYTKMIIITNNIKIIITEMMIAAKHGRRISSAHFSEVHFSVPRDRRVFSITLMRNTVTRIFQCSFQRRHIFDFMPLLLYLLHRMHALYT